MPFNSVAESSHAFGQLRTRFGGWGARGSRSQRRNSTDKNVHRTSVRTTDILVRREPTHSQANDHDANKSYELANPEPCFRVSTESWRLSVRGRSPINRRIARLQRCDDVSRELARGIWLVLHPG